jgi:TonB family protein
MQAPRALQLKLDHTMNFNYANTPPFPDGRHPLTAAILSVVPGLGQVYVGDKRKGILFLNVAFINALLLSLCLCANQIFQSLTNFSASYHMHVNQDAAVSLHHLNFGSPASLMLVALAGAFAIFCARDAYDRAYSRRKPIYKDFIIELSESSSVSYLTHFALMVCFAIMALFFVAAPERPSQLLEIVLADQAPIAKPKLPTSNISKHSTAESGSLKPVTHEAPPSQHAAPQGQSAQSQPKASRPTHAVEHARSEAPPTPRQTLTPPRPAQPMPQPANIPLPAPAAPMVHSMPMHPMAGAPVPKALNVGAAAMSPLAPLSAAKSLVAMAGPAPIAPVHTFVTGALPLPSLPQAAAGPSAGLPQVSAAHIASGNGVPAGGLAPSKFQPIVVSAGGGQPMPRAITESGPSGTGTAPAPAPVALSSARSKNEGPGNDVSGVLPRRSSGAPDGTNGRTIAVAPRLADDGDGVHSNVKGPSVKPANPRPVEVDFGPYMAELQRRIRKHWFPPHAPTTRVAIVTFCLARDGTLSNVRLIQSTGEKSSDDAALQAVQESSPFHELPQGAPPQVDIEFTFSYNVFSQDGVGHARRVF